MKMRRWRHGRGAGSASAADFQGDAAALGRPSTCAAKPTVVGIMPRDFRTTCRWTCGLPAPIAHGEGAAQLRRVARLRPGGVAAASGQLKALSLSLREDRVSSGADDFEERIVPFQSGITRMSVVKWLTWARS
jgi:hypothetical protein